MSFSLWSVLTVLVLGSVARVWYEYLTICFGHHKPIL